MPVLSFGEFRPDVSDYSGQTSQTVLNVLPRGDGYGPFSSLADYTGALAAQCRGYFYARNSDGSITIFAGTSTKLYKLNNTSGLWTDVSPSGGTYSALVTTAQWQFCQFNSLVIAVQANANPQVFTLGSSSEFADLGGSPPKAAYVAIVNRFVVLSGLASNPYRIHWSGLNDTTEWSSGVNSSDYQDFADGGIVRGVSGGEFGTIFQDAAIRRMIYAPGSAYVFGISRVSQDDGLFAPYSLVNSGDRTFFCSPQGFKMILPSGYPTPIGKERVDRTFFRELDTGNLQFFIGASDPRTTRVYWAYKSVDGLNNLFDKILIYDWALDKWSMARSPGEYIASLSRPGLTLEGVDAAYSPQTATFTVTIATPGVFSRTAHGFVAGNQVTLGTTGALPTGLTTVTPYYVISAGLTADAFRVSATLGGSAINTSGSQSGTHYLPTVDGITISSLDDISNAAFASLSAASSVHKIGFFTGAALEAALETPEQGGDGRRIFVSGFRPITDAATVYGSVTYRETAQAVPETSPETLVNAVGTCPQRVSTRYARGVVRIPAGTAWTFAAGVEPDVKLEGGR